MIDPIDLHAINWKDTLFGREELKEEVNELRERVNQYENAAMWADMMFLERHTKPGKYRLVPRGKYIPVHENNERMFPDAPSTEFIYVPKAKDRDAELEELKNHPSACGWCGRIPAGSCQSCVSRSMR